MTDLKQSDFPLDAVIYTHLLLYELICYIQIVFHFFMRRSVLSYTRRGAFRLSRA
jgi:hypothetical protein